MAIFCPRCNQSIAEYDPRSHKCEVTMADRKVADAPDEVKQETIEIYQEDGTKLVFNSATCDKYLSDMKWFVKYDDYVILNEENQRLLSNWNQLKGYIEAIRQTTSVAQDLVIDDILRRMKALTAEDGK